MLNRALYCSVLIILFSAADIFPQELMDNAEWLKIDEDLVFSIVTVTDRNNNVTKGLLHGMKGDTLYLFYDSKVNGVNIRDAVMITIKDDRTEYNYFTYGLFSTMYFGSFLLLTSEADSYFLQEIETVPLLLYELGLAFLGGGIGYGIDRAIKKDQEVFIFNDEKKEIEKFKRFLTNSSGGKKFHLYLTASSISTKLKELEDKYGLNSYFNHRELNNINMIRRISASYQISDYFALGIGFANFDEPSFEYYNYEQQFYHHSYFEFGGHGYYIILNIPLWLSEKAQLLFTGGAGFGKVNFSYRSEIYNEENIKISFNETVFTSLAAGELSYFFLPGINFSVQADYIYVPKKIPALPPFETEKSLGNFSFGFGLGYHF